MSDHQIVIANTLLDIKAVGFIPNAPITFKSGLKAPMYIDNRRFIYHPKEWKLVIDGFQSLLESKRVNPDVIAGIESAGIPHSSVLGYVLEKPTVFVRKKLKDHGTQIPIEGGDVSGKDVLLIEDNISSGSSSLHGVNSLRDAGGKVDYLFTITSYEFAESVTTFNEAKIEVSTLTTVSIILNQARERKLLSESEFATVSDWYQDPWGWAGQRETSEK